jgi:NADPH:quinone reductase
VAPITNGASAEKATRETTMKAIQFSRFGGPEVLEYVDLPRPAPKGDEVIIEVTASGVNFPDIRQRTGVYQRAETHVGGVTLPYVTGLQVVGKVIEVGPEGNRTLDGKKVLAFLPQGGGYAQIAKASSGMAVPLPESVDDVQMAALPTQGLTAYLMLTALTKLTKGESILVHGAGGGVGSMAVQIAKILGASTIVATAGTQEKREYTRTIGADFSVDYEKPDWPKAVLKYTDGRGVDVLLESIGGNIFE